MLTVDDLSQMLKVSRVAIYKWVRLKTVPYFHINKAVRFSPSDIEKWLEEKRGQEYHRDRGKEAPECGILPHSDASAMEGNKRKPEPTSGTQNQGIENII